MRELNVGEDYAGHRYFTRRVRRAVFKRLRKAMARKIPWGEANLLIRQSEGYVPFTSARKTARLA